VAEPRTGLGVYSPDLRNHPCVTSMISRRPVSLTTWMKRLLR
jgi:hypothetical protein